MKTWLVAISIGTLLVTGCRRPCEPTIDQQETASVLDEVDDSSVDGEDSNIRSILDQIVSIVLTLPDLKDSREFYGTPEDTRCALVSNEHHGIPWPEWYTPKMEGVEFAQADEGSEVEPSNRRLLGIRIDKLSLEDKTGKDTFTLLTGPVQVTLLNAGGDPDGSMVIGGAMVYFRIEWEDGKPKLVYAGLLDP